MSSETFQYVRKVEGVFSAKEGIRNGDTFC